ncbi:nuclear transport factor 2 family protein [Aestuariibacter halophilus]|uniref:Nuclear transport factor 2 family protein n=1 Tax=Fluctibacter halophilus TaxID=226011 RepID=A0ABS8GAY7_9ALTE|nr:nuclear transport factor 2 family protein [Aestuariibacter halophilus]MCC2617755.1 nuclear transport factor 2 family protein [Aestuariibacter halophilus]
MDAKECVTAFIAFANEGNMDKCTALLSDELVWTDVGTTPFSGRYEGKTRVLEGLIGPLFSQLKAGIHTEIEAMIAESDRVVVLSKGTAETLDGRPYNNDYCQVFTVRDGLIVEVIEYCDTEMVNRVFGSGTVRG